MSTTTAHRRTSTNSNTSQNSGIARQIRRAILIAGLLSVLIGIAIGILQIRPTLLSEWLSVQIQPAGIALVGMVLIGLIGGLVIGLSLLRTMLLVRLVSALLVVVMGWLTSELTQGIALGLFLHDSLIRAGDLLALSQLGAGALVSIVSVLVTRRLRFRVGTASPAPQTGTGSRRPRRRSQPSNGRSSRRSSNSPETASAVGSDSRVKIAPVVGKRQIRHRRNVHLKKDVIEVCPYCLEEVKPRDPRGRVVCDICHTAHHADCWAIAGRCQVPHLQT